MNDLNWQFLTVPVGSREIEHIAEEFFSSADSVSEATGLVRETIQNSLDEVYDKTKPIRMVFTIGSQTPGVARKYFQKLYPHVVKTGLREIPNFEAESKFLVIEDFNTLGLEGPTSSTAPTDQELLDRTLPYKFSFWHFEWKAGGSHKSSGNRGSWGVGKIVLPRASRIKAYLVFSVRRPETSPDGNPSILFGHSILKFREIDNKRLVPDCQWMVADTDGAPIPSSNSLAQEEFIFDWGLSRQLNVLGTSIVVPFCRDEMNAENLIQSIVRDYFISILGGQLECVVRDVDGTEISINKNSIVELIESFQNENLPRGTRSADEMKALCEMYIAHENSLTTKMTIPLLATAPNDWSEITFSDEVATLISGAFNSGKIIELTVEVAIPTMTSPQKQVSVDSYTVLLKKVLELRSSTVFCREGILIPAANTASNLQNCVSMVIVGDMKSVGSVDNSLADLLKNAEGPSHDRWSPDATNFKGRYTPKYKAEVVIRWVRTSAERCLRLIQGAENLEDDVTLSVYFPFSVEDGQDPGSVKVVLSGHRDSKDTEQAKFSWRADGFMPTAYVFKQLSPSEIEIERGSDSSGTSSTSLKDGPEATYRFQMEMTHENQTVFSNVVEIRPRPEPRGKVQIQKTERGFEIVSPDVEKPELNSIFTVAAAYRSRGSSSVRKWTSEDFLLEDRFSIGTLKGLKVLESAENYCRFEVIEKEFHAEWGDFDVLRDLVVEVVGDEQ
jgi:hypothetical protein